MNHPPQGPSIGIPFLRPAPMNKKKIVLYQPKQIDEALGLESSKDLLPIEMLQIASLPLQDGYEVEIIDGGLYPGDEGHRRLAAACEDAMLLGVTAMLGYMVIDSDAAVRHVHAKHPDLPVVIGGWFASVMPELLLATGMYRAVAHGQGEITFREVVQAIDAGEDLEQVAGLSIWRDGRAVRTAHRSVVGWNQIPNAAWHLIDIEPYRDHQLRARSAWDFLRLPTPPSIGYGKPYFGISYFSSFGCPEPCAFCCSPEVTQRRWKAMPADRMLDDLSELHDRWGFDVVRFQDANWGVAEKRSKEFAEGKIARGLPFEWNNFMETHSILHYKPETMDALADSGFYIAQVGAEAGTDEMMKRVGKPIRGDDNVNAAIELDRRGIQASINYIIGYPGEAEESMLASIDQCRRVHNAAPLSRATVWPFRPVPGTSMWHEAVELGFEGPDSIEEWGHLGEYHVDERYQTPIPSNVSQARRLYQHYATLSYGLVRGKIGWWERRAQRRLEDGTYIKGRSEARAFSLYHRVTKRLLPSREQPRSGIDPGHAQDKPQLV